MEKWVLRSLICAGKSFWKFQIVTRYRGLHYFYTTCIHISLKEFWLVLCENWAESVFRIALSHKFHNNIYVLCKQHINMGKFGVFYSIFLLFFVFVLVLNLLWNMNFIIVVFHEIFIALCWSHKNMYKCIVLCPVNVVQAFSRGERGGRGICKVLKRFWKLQVIVKVICCTRWFAFMGQKMLEQCCNKSRQCYLAVTMLCCAKYCKSFPVTSVSSWY